MKTIKELETEAQNALMSFIRGWRKGATGAALEESWQSNEDFMAGHEEGRKASRDAYAEACKQYGTTLSPLR